MSDSGLFHLLLPWYNARHLDHPCDTTVPIQACQPHFLCFEFDIPQASDLAVLQQTKLQHPDLPLLMITESHSESLAVWAFRSGVWDYLVKPLTAGDLNTRIETLFHLCHERYASDVRLPHPAPLPDSVHRQALQEIAQGQKTILAREFVANHFAEVVRLPVVAGLCHMSESEFSRTFKRENGQTFCDYLLKYRITRARELLSDLSVQVKTVAFDVGFNDVSYFARTFRRYTGLTPSAYQQERALEIPDSVRSSQHATPFSHPA